MQIILASQSPRRKNILSEITKNFIIIPSNAEENVDLSLPPEIIVQTLAKAKAEQVFKEHDDCAVIGSDTIVYFNGKVLGKPKDEEDAFNTLSLLSANEHSVYTGVCVCAGKEIRTFSCRTRVVFNSLSERLIREYIATGSPMDKAGSYGFQDNPALVKEYFGSYTNIIGLPKEELEETLVSMRLI